MVKKKNTTNIIILILIVILIIIIIAILYFYKKEKFIVKNEAARQTLNFLENKGWIKEEKLKNYIEQPKLGLGTFAPVPPPPRTKKPKKPHLGEQVSRLELAKVGVALDGGRGCAFVLFLWFETKGEKGEVREAERLRERKIEKVAESVWNERSAFLFSLPNSPSSCHSLFFPHLRGPLRPW